MYRVELKASKKHTLDWKGFLFLMHRVELKESYEMSSNFCTRQVPNAPCGVERRMAKNRTGGDVGVPNAPCGVESRSAYQIKPFLKLFLMHRVELKVSCLIGRDR